MDNELFEQNDNEMSADIITLEDEDGVEHVFEIVDDTDINDTRYLAVVPYAENEEDFSEEVELLIMRASELDGEEVLDIVDDEIELAEVGAVFAKRLEELFEIDLDTMQELGLDALED